MKTVLVISAHADDEAFGMGGTLAHLAADPAVSLVWLIASRIWEPKWNSAALADRERAIKGLSEHLGFREVIRWEYPDNRLDTIPIDDLQTALIEVLDRVRPQTIYMPSRWDFNFEHRLLFDLVEMSTKTYYTPYVERVLAYEIPSSTDGGFQSFGSFPANWYVDIEAQLERKVEFMRLFSTELHEFPHPRSEAYVRALAQKRGGEAGLRAAECFVLCRQVVR
jgi:LmbE family N-acetylglucosaminyl deacetylase